MEPLRIAVGNVKWSAVVENSSAVPEKVKHRVTINLYANVHSSITPNSQIGGNNPTVHQLMNRSAKCDTIEYYLAVKKGSSNTCLHYG